MAADIRIKGGRVHTPGGAIQADILIRGERIAGLVEPDDPTEAKEVIDAAGLDVIPGVIDLHAHSRTPGFSHKEDFQTLSMAAAVGGITTWVDMPNVQPPTDSVETFLEKKEMASRDSIVDFGHFVSASKPDKVPDLFKQKVTGYKIFMIGGGYPHDDRIAVSANDTLYEGLEAVADTGLPCLVHPFDQALFNMFTKRKLAEGRKPDYILRGELYTGIDIVWRSAIATLLEVQKDTNVRLQVLHTHAIGSLELIRRAKAEGHRITTAVDLKYFNLTRADMERQGPRAYSGAIITENPKRMALIWQSLKDGTLDMIDSDHAPHQLHEIEVARTNAWKAQMGSPQYDHELAVMLNSVHLGKLDMPDIVRLMCENPARLIGYYPRKGALLPGSDADITLVDLNKTVVLTSENVKTKAGFTPYEGWEVTGVPTLTMVRGTVVARGNEVVGKPGHGRYLEGRPLEWSEPSAGQSPGLALRPKTA